MCTSFVFRKNDNIIIGMNFDNNGMPFVVKKHSQSFVALVDGGRGKSPSFGVNSDGDFINNLMVDSNGKGLYKRMSSKVIHTSKLTDEVLAGNVKATSVKSYLEDLEYVNPPALSVHNMIVDKKGTVAVTEPGRGIIYSKTLDSPYFIMTNFSLCDYSDTGELKGCGTDRYLKTKQLLDGKNDIDIAGAFEILNQVKQSEGDWITAFSMIYSAKENVIYYCFNGEFSSPDKHILC